MQELGTNDPDFFAGFAKLAVIANSDGNKCDEVNSDFDLAFVRGIKPRDQVEAALAMQMAATHRLIMGCTRHLLSATSPLEIEIYGQLLTKLNRTYLAQMEALKIYRRSDNPVVPVENVSQHGRTAPDTKPAPPFAITAAKIAPMPLVSGSELEPVAARGKREE
jgi:hypothetical protein